MEIRVNGGEPFATIQTGDFFFPFLLLKEICSLYVYAGKIYSGKKKLMEKYTLLWQILELRET